MRHFRTSIIAVSTLCAALLAPAAPASGQEASLGADVVSRYVWRGTDFGESMAVQPWVTFGVAGLEFGAWGSYSISADGATANENDFWASYTLETSAGLSVSFGFTDYYFPAPQEPGPAAPGFGSSDSHTLEFSLGLSGPSEFPLTLFAGMLTNDTEPEPSLSSVSTLYVEVGAPFYIGDVDFAAHAGMVSGASSFYGTSNASVVNLGLTASKGLQITQSFELPVFVSYIVNPDQDRAHLVFGFSLAP